MRIPHESTNNFSYQVEIKKSNETDSHETLNNEINELIFLFCIHSQIIFD